jgi:hypothetical protein
MADGSRSGTSAERPRNTVSARTTRRGPTETNTRTTVGSSDAFIDDEDVLPEPRARSRSARRRDARARVALDDDLLEERRPVARGSVQRWRELEFRGYDGRVRRVIIVPHGSRGPLLEDD